MPPPSHGGYPASSPAQPIPQQQPMSFPEPQKFTGGFMPAYNAANGQPFAAHQSPYPPPHGYHPPPPQAPSPYPPQGYPPPTQPNHGYPPPPPSGYGYPPYQ